MSIYSLHGTILHFSLHYIPYEYLLLPPRSALMAAPLKITLLASTQPSRPPTPILNIKLGQV